LDYHHDVGSCGVGIIEITMNDSVAVSLPGSRYLVLGLGQTGQTVARWLVSVQCSLRLVDTRHDLVLEPLRTDLADTPCEWHLGQPLTAAMLENMDAVVISPGLSPHQAPVAEFLRLAEQAGKPVIGDIELFALALHSLQQSHDYRPAVVAVTGTNGKTTVTALARHMLQANGAAVVAAGNIGPPVLQVLQDALLKPQDQWPEVWVLELSSFQLHHTQSLAPKVAVVLNLTQDHLDWHASADEYRADKARIYLGAEICVVNRDDPEVSKMVPSLAQQTVRSFGLDTPLFTHDVGIELSHDVRWLASAEPTEFEEPPKPTRRRKPEALPDREPGRLVRLMPADALPLVGAHNTANVLAAALLARALGASWAQILKAATSYHGEPHRMQFVRTVRDVEFFNDSKGTNVGATVAAVSGLEKSLVLIAGGQSKGQDFSALAQVLTHKVRAVVLMGEDAELLQQSFEPRGIDCQIVDSLKQAVSAAFERAQPGDAVVLSPACASFDMFSGYAQRGMQFMDEVTELALSTGEVA